MPEATLSDPTLLDDLQDFRILRAEIERREKELDALKGDYARVLRRLALATVPTPLPAGNAIAAVRATPGQSVSA